MLVFFAGLLILGVMIVFFVTRYWENDRWDSMKKSATSVSVSVTENASFSGGKMSFEKDDELAISTTVGMMSDGINADIFVTDHEGNVYNTVKIGNQCWMKDNLRTTTSPSTGTYLIPEAGTTHTYSGKQARWYNNDSATYANQNYGLLYNWNAAVDTFNTSYDETSVITSPNYAANALFSGNRRGICPEGWHVPSDAEWTELVTYVSSQPAYISEYDTYHDSTWVAKALALDTLWSTNISTCAVGNDVPSNNLSQFSAVPAGIFQKTNYSSGSSVSEFKYSKNHACFWSSTQNGTNAKSRFIVYDAPNIKSNYSDYGAGKGMGMSVRCLRD